MLDKNKFIDRKHELSHLNSEYKSAGAKLVILYGRRRVGKTRLIEEFIKDKDYVYYLAAQENEKQQIDEFKSILSAKLNDEFLAGADFDGWKSLFDYLKKIWPKEKRIIIAIDEATFIIKATPSFPSYLQKFWEEFLNKTNAFLIISGSLVGLMIENFLANSSPLYGRRTSQIQLEAFLFKDAKDFIHGFDFEEQIKFYFVIGGVAKYLLLADESFEDFLVNKFLNKEGFFYKEGAFLLSDEFKEPSTYADILKAISFQKTKINDIANFVGVDTKKISRYLDILINLGLIKKEVPITEDEKEFRGALYLLNDNYLSFWSRFINPSRSYLEIRNINIVLEKINSEFNHYSGRMFENLCKEGLTGEYPKIGSWWSRKGDEIDIVALNDDKKEILFAECKWSLQKVDVDLYNSLKEKTKLVDWNIGKRVERFALFSKSGFTSKMMELAKKEKVKLYDLKAIEKLII